MITPRMSAILDEEYVFFFSEFRRMLKSMQPVLSVALLNVGNIPLRRELSAPENQNGKKTGASQTVITPTRTASGAPILTKSIKLYSPGPWTMRLV